MSSLRVGMSVRKITGYPFIGIVVAKFPDLACNIRYVIEHETEAGMLRIYSGEELVERAPVTEPKPAPPSPQLTIFWCGQCERKVTAPETTRCTSKWCGGKVAFGAVTG